MQKPEPAYSGDAPYAFVCYSHRDKATVYAEIRSLLNQGIIVWYVEGIDAGVEWSDRLADAISG